MKLKLTEHAGIIILLQLYKQNIQGNFEFLPIFTKNENCKNLAKGCFVVDMLNVCGLLNQRASSNKTLSKLTDICMYINIETSDILTKERKRPYVKKIENFV